MRCRPFAHVRRERRSADGRDRAESLAVESRPTGEGGLVLGRIDRPLEAVECDGCLALRPGGLPEALDDAGAVHEDGLEHAVQAGHDPRRMQRIADVAAIRVPEEVLVEGGEREAA